MRKRHQPRSSVTGTLAGIVEMGGVLGWQFYYLVPNHSARYQQGFWWFSLICKLCFELYFGLFYTVVLQTLVNCFLLNPEPGGMILEKVGTNGN